jgi:PKD repeat protein
MKKIYTLFFIAFSFFTRAQLALDSGLVACYSLNGHGADAINGLHGTAYRLNAATNRLNVPNACMNFSCDPQAFLELPNSPLLKSQQLSFSAWIKPVASFYSKGYVLYTAFSGTAAPGYALTIESSGNAWVLKLRRQTPGGLATIQSTLTIPLNSWTHVGFSLDNFLLRLYVNGVSQGSVTAAGAVQYLFNSKVYLGATNELNHSEPFSGAIDNVRFYNRILTTQDFLNLKNLDPACVTATAVPVANFMASLPACVNQPMQFLNLSTNYPDFYAWQISNAVLSNSMQSNPVVTFTASGTYSAVLSVSNALGTSSLAATFTIHPKPNVQASANRTLTCRGLGTTLTAVGAQTYTWSIGAIQSAIFVDPSGSTQYTVTGTDSLGCINSATVFIKTVTDCYRGINEENAEAVVSIFPNPSSYKIWISSESEHIQSLKILDLLGREYEATLVVEGNEQTIDVSNLQTGLYELEVQMQGKVIRKKVMIE